MMCKLQKAMMEIYRKENQSAGWLFTDFDPDSGVYGLVLVLLESVELRQLRGCRGIKFVNYGSVLRVTAGYGCRCFCSKTQSATG